ncbi:antirestriction protein ArdR [Xenorhabdus budapestensis]|uniref:Antirestriction protein ArdR n=1 Tax=Xenorhabdus budapestensis TaxID=290110 RepID=A0A2D0IT39_XENBU|nr:antirestriction protein ArdR [Xenorhabdus budapestensis]PHM25067.1 hypothetical protein Xbud_03140 [Xenorhabdus budapestensis]
MNPIETARFWRQQNAEHSNSGVVLIWEGKVYSWKNCLRDAQHERPGAIAVDVSDSVFIAQGGNDYDGAKGWIVLKK